MNVSAAPDPAAAWIWCDPHGTGRNVFAIFRSSLQLDAAVESAWLHLCAGTRYRLRVNGAVAAAGPARGVPAFPEYDRVDLRPWLCAGANVLVVEVCHYGGCAYQAMPEDRGGFIAWGAITTADGRTHDLATPGGWRVRTGDAWNAQAPRFSFAQPAVEDLDTRRWDGGATPDVPGAWQAPRPCAAPLPWGPLTPRSVPTPWFDEQEFLDVLQAVPLVPERRHTVCVAVPGLARDRHSGDPLRFAVAAWLHADRAGTATLGLFWGPFHLDGTLLEGRPDPRCGNRLNYPVCLKAGWQLLYGEVEQLEEVWGVLLALPEGVRAHLAPDHAAARGLRCTAALPESRWRTLRDRPPATRAELDALNVAWRDVRADSRDALPARECAWDTPARRGAIAAPELPLHLAAGQAWCVVLDFGGEFLGHAIVAVEAPRGTVLDVAVDERLREDGLPALFATNPFTDCADRFILHGGLQRIDGFHVRGGRYLALTLRPPEGAGEACALHRVAIRRVRAALPVEGDFASSDALFDWVWRTGIATLHACTEDVFLDCPWRERGLYAGDFHVIAQVQRLTARDPRLVRRGLRLFAQARRDDGLLPNVAPAWNRKELADFTLLWILTLRDHCDWTGDVALARELWPVVEGIWRSTAWTPGVGGLWDTGTLEVFVDWGCPQKHKSGAAHGVLNILRVAALHATAELAGLAGDSAAHAAYARDAARLTDRVRDLLWIEECGAYAVCLPAPDTAPEPSLHASLLALAFEIESETQRAPLLAFVRAALRGNFAAGVTGEGPYGHAELYFLHYALRALYRFDLAGDAEALVQTHYAPLQAADAWTLWECFARGLQGVGSLCHAWSAGPLIGFVRDVAGIQPRRSGDGGLEVLIAPCAETLDCAAATLPHPLGDLHVAWRIADDVLRVTVVLPEGVAWRWAPRGRLAARPCRIEFRNATPAASPRADATT